MDETRDTAYSHEKGLSVNGCLFCFSFSLSVPLTIPCFAVEELSPSGAESLGSSGEFALMDGASEATMHVHVSHASQNSNSGLAYKLPGLPGVKL